ncbi:MAG: hypothetical protein HYY48_03330 [Gammaproteobacteria bacterium]|nr:hypothetical protein [Gammaproteobacteria bacterium]
MNTRQALSFIRKHGVVLVSARGPVPNLAEAIAGERIHGSWWGHAKSQQIFNVLEEVRDSDEVLVCRLVGGKVTLVHRRLWPALIRLAGRFPKRSLDAIREEHTASGRHRVIATPYPRWVPKVVLAQGKRLSVEKALSLFDPAAVIMSSFRTGP